MSLRLRRIAVSNFRKFREPMVIEGIADGLNIIIEPNESGKSMLLHAVRAALFVRYATKNQLAQSYAPFGDAVAPEISLDLEINNAQWSVTKRFLKGGTINVSGPDGRAEGDAAEERLHNLLGSVRDSSREGDVATHGALGLLWVAQTEALSIEPPGRIVRDSIQATLEAEVGSIMGSATYQRVHDRIGELFSQYWTPTAKKGGLQNSAQERLDKAESAAREAANQLAGLEKTFADLDTARTRLRGIQREIADDTDAQDRAKLVDSLRVASAAVHISDTRRAEHEAAGARLRTLEDIDERHRRATQAREAAQHDLVDIESRRDRLAEAVAIAKLRHAEARDALEHARAARQAARSALAAAKDRIDRARRKEAITAACLRINALTTLERQLTDERALATALIPTTTLDSLEANERAVAEARAILSAGATRIRIEGDIAGILIDGQSLSEGDLTITREARIRFGGADLIVTPPPTTASAEVALAVALQRQKAALDELDVADVAAARARHEQARRAESNVRVLESQIDAAAPADDRIDLARGSDALKAFITGLSDAVHDETAEDDLPDLLESSNALEDAELAAVRAEGTQQSTIEALQRAEQELAPLVAAAARAASDLANATEQIQAINAQQEFADLSVNLVQARMELAKAGVMLSDAERDVNAHDKAAIERRIEMIDLRAKSALEARSKFEMEIARLEGAVESEGGKGLADREVAAREEAEAARFAHQRVTEEADTLKLLRDTLDEARNEVSAKFVGPVAKRAKRYIERLLPGSEPAFTDDLALGAIIRGGASEECEHLSQGTREQLSVLLRIAFADLLLDQGRPVSLILDDPFVYSDDARLDVMIEILSETAQRMQVILLTCRDRAFRHVPATRLFIGPPL